MKPLRDETGSSDPAIAEAARLVSQVRPWGESDVRAQRVRRALDRRASGERRWGPGVALGLLLLLGTSAAAAWGAFRWLDPSTDGSGMTSGTSMARGSGSAMPLDRAMPPAAHDSSDDDLPGDEVVPDTASTKTFVEGDAVGPPNSVVGNGAPDRRAASGQAGTSRNKAPAPTLSEARLVQQAVEALRSSSDPDKADKLLAQYRQTSKSGTLDEEALALSIEVALAKKDARARDYARQYLRTYPDGRFSQLARRALEKR